MIRELRYKLVENHTVVAEGRGETIDIGSGGVSFIVAEALRVGAFIELSVSWPVLLEANTRMRLVVFGRMVRTSDRISACTVDKYEFRTQARTVTAYANARRDGMLQRWVEEMQKDVLKARSALA